MTLINNTINKIIVNDTIVIGFIKNKLRYKNYDFNNFTDINSILFTIRLLISILGSIFTEGFVVF
jgi:hypothetical protein